MGNNLTPPANSRTEADNNEDEPPQLRLSSQPPANQTFTCQICIEPVTSPTEVFENIRCGPHPFCKDCMIKYIQAKLDDNVSEIPCPALNCSEKLDPHACRSLVGPQLFVKWCDSLCESAVMVFDHSYCPNRNCSAMIVNECGGDVKKATCPLCKRLFCFHCKLPWHAGFRCEESGELRDRNDRAFGVLAEQNKWMRCPRCRHFVERIEGCRIVRCRCATSFCYRCGRTVNPNWCGCERPSGAFIACHTSFCYKCGRQVNQIWCSCDGTSRCCTWFLRVFAVLNVIVWVFALVFKFGRRPHSV